jgi:hypothetical protein
MHTFKMPLSLTVMIAAWRATAPVKTPTTDKDDSDEINDICKTQSSAVQVCMVVFVAASCGCRSFIAFRSCVIHGEMSTAQYVLCESAFTVLTSFEEIAAAEAT